MEREVKEKMKKLISVVFRLNCESETKAVDCIDEVKNFLQEKYNASNFDYHVKDLREWEGERR